MFIRRKRNRTGSVSVQLIDGRHKVVKSFGAGRSAAEVEALVREAERYVESRSGRQLPLFPDERDALAEELISQICNSQVFLAGPELIFGRIFDAIGFGGIGGDVSRHLVITRLFRPGSKLKTVDYLRRYLGVDCDANKFYRFLDKLSARGDGAKGIKSLVEEAAFRHSRNVLGGAIGAVFYDMTTLYFEASDEDDLRVCGFSKDGKHHCPQIYLGLLVGLGGNPLCYEVFEGNVFEGKTMVPLLRRFEGRFHVGRPVVIADSGLLSKSNVEELARAGYRYILGARPKNEGAAVRAKILAAVPNDGDVAAIDKGDGSRLIVSRSAARARKDARNRERGLERLRKNVKSGRLTKASVNNRGYNKYLRIEGDARVAIDMAKYEADAAWDGVKGYVTNADLPPGEVISNYKGLWRIERAFRMNKTDLRIRPIYHRLRNRIEGHVCVCFTAYTVMLELERMLAASGWGISCQKAGELAATMYRIKYRLPASGKECSQLLKMDADQQRLYDLVNQNYPKA